MFFWLRVVRVENSLRHDIEDLGFVNSLRFVDYAIATLSDITSCFSEYVLFPFVS